MSEIAELLCNWGLPESEAAGVVSALGLERGVVTRAQWPRVAGLTVVWRFIFDGLVELSGTSLHNQQRRGATRLGVPPSTLATADGGGSEVARPTGKLLAMSDIDKAVAQFRKDMITKIQKQKAEAAHEGAEVPPLPDMESAGMLLSPLQALASSVPLVPLVPLVPAADRSSEDAALATTQMQDSVGRRAIRAMPKNRATVQPM